MHKIALTLFVLALLHTLAARPSDALAHDYPRHAGLFHLLDEMEVIFGFWTFVLIAAMTITAPMLAPSLFRQGYRSG